MGRKKGEQNVSATKTTCFSSVLLFFSDVERQNMTAPNICSCAQRRTDDLNDDAVVIAVLAINLSDFDACSRRVGQLQDLFVNVLLASHVNAIGSVALGAMAKLSIILRVKAGSRRSRSCCCWQRTTSMGNRMDLFSD